MDNLNNDLPIKKEIPKPEEHITWCGEECSLEINQQKNYIQLWTETGPMLRASAYATFEREDPNIDAALKQGLIKAPTPNAIIQVKPGYICIKNYSENQGILNALEKAHIIKDTGLKLPAGFTSLALCQLNPHYTDS